MEGAHRLPTRASIARGQECLDHQLQHLDFARVHQWAEVAAQVRKRNLSRRVAPVQYEPAWHPQKKIMMSGDMPIVLLDVINSVLGPELRVEWDEECLNLEISMEESLRGLKTNRLCFQARGPGCHQQS